MEIAAAPMHVALSAEACATAVVDVGRLNFFYVTAPGKSPHYTVDASSDDEDLTLTIDPSGKILEKEQR